VIAGGPGVSFRGLSFRHSRGTPAPRQSFPRPFRFFSPWGLALLGNKLLVTNGDLEPGDHPDAWKIFKVDVGETGLPLNRPRVPVNRAPWRS